MRNTAVSVAPICLQLYLGRLHPFRVCHLPNLVCVTFADWPSTLFRLAVTPLQQRTESLLTLTVDKFLRDCVAVLRKGFVRTPELRLPRLLAKPQRATLLPLWGGGGGFHLARPGAPQSQSKTESRQQRTSVILWLCPHMCG